MVRMDDRERSFGPSDSAIDELPPVTVSDIVRVASTGDQQATLALLELAASQGSCVLHTAAALGDRGTFSLLLSLLPHEEVVRAFRRVNKTNQSVLDCMALHHELARDIQQVLLDRGIDLVSAGDQWEYVSSLKVFHPPTKPMRVCAFLAPKLYVFRPGHVFIEASAETLLASVAASDLLLVKSSNHKMKISGLRAKAIVGSLTPATLRSFGVEVFIAVASASAVLPTSSRVATYSLFDDEPVFDVTSLEASPSRFIVCPTTATTVAATLRAAGVFYAALDAVYVRQVRVAEASILAHYGDKLLAVPTNGSSAVLRGSGIAELSVEGSFRARFDVFAPAQEATQVLDFGSTVLLDVENLAPPVGTNKHAVFLGCYPTAGRLDTNTPTHHNVCISDEGARVADKGYRDDDFLPGFKRGYDGVYWRTVGDYPTQSLAGGVQGHTYKFRVTAAQDFGVSGKCVMIKLPGEGVVFCRGVASGDDENPEMACVLFHANGTVRETHAYRGQLGRWFDIVQ